MQKPMNISTNMIVNIGSHHPSMHDVLLKFIVILDNEDIIDCEPDCEPYWVIKYYKYNNEKSKCMGKHVK